MSETWEKVLGLTFVVLALLVAWWTTPNSSKKKTPK